MKNSFCLLFYKKSLIILFINEHARILVMRVIQLNYSVETYCKVFSSNYFGKYIVFLTIINILCINYILCHNHTKMLRVYS